MKPPAYSEGGFSDKEEKQIMGLLKPLAASRQPMTASRERFPKAKWVKPEVLVEAEFRGKTADDLPLSFSSTLS